MVVFEVISKTGKKIRLADVQWAHMSSKHPELENQTDKMITTLQEPDYIYHSLNEESFIITGFFISKVRTKNKVLVWKRKS